MSEKRGLGERGKQAVKRVGETVQNVTGTLTGKTLEQQVSEYSDLCTQVLLGLHKDLEAQDRKLQELGLEIEAIKRQIESLCEGGRRKWWRLLWPWRQQC